MPTSQQSGVVMTESSRAVLEKEIEDRLKEEMKKKEIVNQVDLLQKDHV